MGKTKVYYIDNELNIKQGYTSANINLTKVNEVVIDYKNNKLKISSELVADTKDKLSELLKRMEIIRLANKYGMTNIKWVGHNLYFSNSLDNYYVYENMYNKLVWMHCNDKLSKFSNHEHLQKITYSNKIEDWVYIFKSTAEHDPYKLNRNFRNRKLHAFDMVKNNNIPKIKIC